MIRRTLRWLQSVRARSVEESRGRRSRSHDSLYSPLSLTDIIIVINIYNFRIHLLDVR